MNHKRLAWPILPTLFLFAAGSGFLLAQQPAQPQSTSPQDAVSRALRDELARSMEQLRLGDLAKPYFITYRVHESSGLAASAMCGTLLGSNDDASRARTLSVELRVGDYSFDNTNFVSFPSFSPGTLRQQFGFSQLPIDDDYLEIRRQIWLATDASYKQALEQLAGKKAALQNRTRSEDLPDLSKESVTDTTDVAPPIEMKRPDVESLVRTLSKLLGNLPTIDSSSVSLSVSNGRSLSLNSEGTRFEKSHPLLTLSAAASTHAPDGMKLGDSISLYASSLDGVPSREQLTLRMQDLAARLTVLRDAPTLDHYNGPVLFDGRAAAEIFSREFAPAFVGQRKPVSSASEMEIAFQRFSQLGGPSFAGKIGARVLPEFLNVTDNPTMIVYGKEPLFGGYKVDDEGVPARETKLVENGILKTLLTGRAPVEGVSHSTGNHRGGSVMPSNLIVGAREGLSDTELKNRFLELVKKRGLEYGILIREIGSSSGTNMEEQAAAMLAAMTGQQGAGTSVLLAYKVYPDGHEQLVRGALLSAMSAESFKEIVAVSKSATVFNTPHVPHFNFSSSFFSSFGEEMSGPASLPLVSYVVPSMLLEDVSLIKPSQETPKPPLSDPPSCAP